MVLVGLGEALEHHAHCALDGRLHVLLLGDGRAGLHLDDGVRLDVVQQRDVDRLRLLAWRQVQSDAGELELVGTRKEGNVLFNDALNTFYLWLYGNRHMVKDHSDSEKGNKLPPHKLLFPINSKGSFIFTIPQTG